MPAALVSACARTQSPHPECREARVPRLRCRRQAEPKIIGRQGRIEGLAAEMVSGPHNRNHGFEPAQSRRHDSEIITNIPGQG